MTKPSSTWVMFSKLFSNNMEWRDSKFTRLRKLPGLESFSPSLWPPRAIPCWAQNMMPSIRDLTCLLTWINCVPMVSSCWPIVPFWSTLLLYLAQLSIANLWWLVDECTINIPLLPVACFQSLNPPEANVFSEPDLPKNLHGKQKTASHSFEYSIHGTQLIPLPNFDSSDDNTNLVADLISDTESIETLIEIDYDVC